MNNKYIMDCGCSFDVDDEQLAASGKTLDDFRKEGILPPLKFDPSIELPDCKKVWNMLGKGLTKGVFQLETNLGKSWCKKLRPESIEHLAALGALLRPGPLESKDENGISMTDHYCRRKNNEEETVAIHESIAECLQETYQVLTYQEQAMAIAKKVAGFSMAEADSLRKAIGKKLPEEMAKVKSMFIEKSVTLGLGQEDAEKIFGFIEKAQRYSFNKCLSLDTIIQKQTGELLEIKDVKIGDSIKSREGATTVLDIIKTGKQKVYEICLESGKTIKCTLEHRFLCEDGNKYNILEIIENHYKIETED